MKNPCMMKTFAGSIIVVLLIEAALVVVIYVHKDDIKVQMKNALKNYNTDDGTKDGVTKIWDKMQHNYHCCGVEEPHDWEVKFSNTSTPDAVPESCCKVEKPGCGKDARKNPDSKEIYSTGCFEKFALDTTAAGIIGGLLLAIQLLDISCLLYGQGDEKCAGRRLRGTRSADLKSCHGKKFSACFNLSTK
jgi:CD63 antigen